MRISDWSSDVCSSDLLVDRARPREGELARFARDIIIFVRAELTDEGRTAERLFDRLAIIDAGGDRFGQRRVDDIALSPLELRAAAGSEQGGERSEAHTSELQSLMRISYAVFCLKKKNSGNKR